MNNIPLFYGGRLPERNFYLWKLLLFVDFSSENEAKMTPAQETSVSINGKQDSASVSRHNFPLYILR